jgi:hypothetical protein
MLVDTVYVYVCVSGTLCSCTINLEYKTYTQFSSTMLGYKLDRFRHINTLWKHGLHDHHPVTDRCFCKSILFAVSAESIE